jgi:hypothetical protein
MLMDLKYFTAFAGIGLALIAAPVTSAQEPRAATAPQPTLRTQPSVSGGRTQFEHRRWGNRDGNHRWGNHRHRNWHHRRHYPRYHGRYSPFGYGYPYGYGYGYPYFGASAALYYYGYHPAPRDRAYTPRERTYRPDSAGSVVAQVQQELARAGYYRGRVDGVIGNGTRNAIRAYERANGLRADGRIDAELLRSMGIQ